MELNNGKYEIGGVDALGLVEQFDSPLYVYDAEIMRAKYKRMTDAFKGTRLKIKYACKALTNINVLRVFKDMGSGLDTVSIQEVWLGLKAGFAPEDIIYTPNCVSMEEISMAVDAGVRINIDNISILEQFGNKYGSSVPVCIRVNPHIMAGGNSKISVGHIDSKFGISIHQMRHVERVVKSMGIKIEGIHMHTGSDILDVGVFLAAADILLETAMRFPDLNYIDFGSGFKVAYKPGDITTDIEDLGKRMTERFNTFCTEYGKELEIHFEPGKFLVSESGYFLVKVNVIKQTTATVFAGVDSGLNHLIRPMFYDSYHHILNLSNPTGTQRVYTVVGYICETDTFAWDRPISEIREGDILCFLNAGAYGHVMSSNYNSRFRPAEVLVDGGKARLIRRRENLEDLLANQIVE
ncbi:MAG: diaminopimelate decarboxylase [Flavobacteriales bacterium]|nr:diaminopimelate decarboxylase [Flavobacteriales bacterium]